MTEQNLGQDFVVPFALQTDTPKKHIVRFSVEFPPQEQLVVVEGQTCPECKTPLTRTLEDYQFGWGDAERLQLLVQATPLIRCACGDSVEMAVLDLIRQRSQQILRAMESENWELIKGLGEFLQPPDIAKIEDFTFNRWIPGRNR